MASVSIGVGWTKGLLTALLLCSSSCFIFTGPKEGGRSRQAGGGGRAAASLGPWTAAPNDCGGAAREPESSWTLHWTSILSISATAGAVAGLLLSDVSPANALTEQELQALADRERGEWMLTEEEQDRVKVAGYDKTAAKTPVVPRKSLKKENMTENERLKEERLAKDRALMESIPVEDGWKMKMWGMPERGPSRKKKRSSAAQQAKADDLTAIAEGGGQP